MTQDCLEAPSRKRVLIIEDDPDYLGVLKTLCAREGFQVETATEGGDALKKVSGSKPHLIMLDLMLPGMGGFEFLRALSAEGIHVPVIVITARSMDPGTVEIIRQEANVADFFTKPVKAGALAVNLHRLMNTAPPEVSSAIRWA